MIDTSLIKEVLSATPAASPKTMRKLAAVLVALGVLGAAIGFLMSADPAVGWAALLTATVLVIGIAAVGPLLSAIFEMTGAKWGRAYRRLVEASVVLMPVGVAALLVLLAAGNVYLPWVHEHPHVGGKAVWLTRGFWDARVIGALSVSYGLGLYFVYLSMRRDFCLAEVRERFSGKLGTWLAKGITDGEAETARLDKRAAVVAPFVALSYGICFTLLGFDLIMALEPDWFSTLFGAWYFVGNIFFGMALLAIGSVALRRQLGLERFITAKRQSDMATLMLAFCLLNTDFFWNQYLTIWYANLPEETGYLIERTIDTNAPWRSMSFVSLGAFFALPFMLLLLRRVKRSGALLSIVAAVAACGLCLARFIEIGPALLEIEPGGGLGALIWPLLSAGLLLLGLLGLGLLLFGRLLPAVPIMPIGDPVFGREFRGKGDR
ncbi:MAG: hypothetical protein JRF63_09985 [Deltaproteobacteria bacterium]|nr:hypothetical protein [Deltaproteobacteria bacterium]